MAYAGVTGFLGNLEALYDSVDDESAEWEGFLQALDDAFSGTSFTAKDVGVRLISELGLRDALPEELSEAWTQRSASFNKKLGRALRKRLNRRHGPDEYRVERVGSRQGTQLWRVSNGKITKDIAA